MGVWSDCPHSWQERQKLMNCEMYSEGFKKSKCRGPPPRQHLLLLALQYQHSGVLLLLFFIQKAHVLLAEHNSISSEIYIFFLQLKQLKK